MSPEFDDMLREFDAEARDDLVGLWEIVQVLRDHDGSRSPSEIKRLTLAFVGEMLAHGFRAGDPPYSQRGHQRWDNQDADHVIRRIDAEWVALGREPSLSDIAWFALAERERG